MLFAMLLILLYLKGNTEPVGMIPNLTAIELKDDSVALLHFTNSKPQVGACPHIYTIPVSSSPHLLSIYKNKH